MLHQRTIEILVGLFLTFAFGCLLVLALKVSGLTSFFKQDYYTVSAQFDDVGQLKARAIITVAGVTIGEVSSIKLDPTTFKAVVTMNIHSNANAIPDDSSASILTAGLLGDNYISITPMYSPTFLHNGSVIEDTHPAMILEKLIGQLMYKLSSSDSSSNASNNKTIQPSGVTKND